MSAAYNLGDRVEVLHDDIWHKGRVAYTWGTSYGSGGMTVMCALGGGGKFLGVTVGSDLFWARVRPAAAPTAPKDDEGKE